GELPSAPDINAGLFDAAQEKGEMIGMFFGHDHNNGFHGKVRGIPLGYAPSAGYNAYGPGRRRGVRVFHLNQNDLREYSTKVITDNELLGDSPLPNLMTLYDRMPSSFGAAKPMIRKGVAGLALGVGAAVALAVLGKKRKK
ncbi:MAG: hypothetical protein LBG83_08815, partial [Oscillospiraceae bacterium]|nr:hypothetical protein [Oscillospiraceae bacterium]